MDPKASYTEEDLRLAQEFLHTNFPDAQSLATFRAEARRDIPGFQMALKNEQLIEREACERVVEETLADCRCGNIDPEKLLRRLRERAK